MVPPRQVELPVVRIDSAVLAALAPVFPKKRCKWDAPAWPGKTMGSSFARCDGRQRVRKLPVPSPLSGATSVVGWS